MVEEVIELATSAGPFDDDFYLGSARPYLV